ncbi:hypothetical protein D3C71_2004150 [compost metagenome]
MSARLTAAELAAMDRRFQQMGGAPATKTLSQAELRVMEDRFQQMKRADALKAYRKSGGCKV